MRRKSLSWPAALAIVRAYRAIWERKRSMGGSKFKLIVGGLGLLTVVLLAVSSSSWISRAEEPSQSAAPAPAGESPGVKAMENPATVKKEEKEIEAIEKKEEGQKAEGDCCKAGDTTPPV